MSREQFELVLGELRRLGERLDEQIAQLDRLEELEEGRGRERDQEPLPN